mmetsp:Transcript_7637/g.23839  ORF Transcript_7637/g.23839 Transcript_7637/m.23839 type:complete len:548 (-) Transcript_7637:426-2069(-)
MPRVAVLGGGVSGAFFADSLRSRLPHEATLQLDVFEASGRLGGRLLDSAVYGDSADHAVEMGAAMFIGQNRYVAHAVASLGLESQCRATSTKGRSRLLVLGKDGAPVFEESKHKVITLYRMAKRFGLRDVSKLTSRGLEFIANFSRFYELQERGEAFASVKGLFQSVSMAQYPPSTCETVLGDMLSSASSSAADELVSALMRNNYGQAWRPSGALCCFTAVAPLAAGGSKAAYRIVGGNARMVEGLFARSGAVIHLNTTVHSVTTAPSGRYRLGIARTGSPSGGARMPAEESSEQAFSEYDYVVLAAPCASAIKSASDAASQSETASSNLLGRCTRLPFQVVHTTLVYGLIEPRFLGSRLSLPELNGGFSDILVADGSPLPFSSLGMQPSGGAQAEAAFKTCAKVLASPSNTKIKEVPRWKIFSEAPLSGETLGGLFACHDENTIVHHPWDAPGAYPQSRPWPSSSDMSVGLKDGGNFILHASNDDAEVGGMVLYPSAVESATSAMEVMAVAANNAALLMHKDLARRGSLGAVPPTAGRSSTSKEEL